MIRVVSGHVCAGKSTHVAANAKPGDVIVDMDRLALALSHESTPHHDYPDHVVDVAKAARWAAMDQAIRAHKAGGFDLWIVHAYPEDKDMATYRRIGATFVELQADAATLVERASRERPPRVRRLLADRLAAAPAAVPQNATVAGGVGSSRNLPFCP